jgi:hypothetical protein
LNIKGIQSRCQEEAAPAKAVASPCGGSPGNYCHCAAPYAVLFSLAEAALRSRIAWSCLPVCISLSVCLISRCTDGSLGSARNFANQALETFQASGVVGMGGELYRQSSK